MTSITMPWPAPQVWPNYRQSHHWRSYYKHVAAQRQMAWALACEAGISKRDIAWNDDGRTISVQVVISPPDRRRRDRDGMQGACKSILDGVSDALGVDDQYFAPTYVITEPVKGGKIVVTLGGRE